MYKLIPRSIRHRVTHEETILYRCPRTVEFAKLNLTFFIDEGSRNDTCARVDVIIRREDKDYPIATNVPVTLPEISPELSSVYVKAGDEIIVFNNKNSINNESNKPIPVNIRAFIYETIDPMVVDAGVLFEYRIANKSINKLPSPLLGEDVQFHGTLAISNPTNKTGVKFKVWIGTEEPKSTSSKDTYEGIVKTFHLEEFETLYIENLTLNSNEGIFVQSEMSGIYFTYNGTMKRVEPLVEDDKP